jgi:hypothetical protein
MTTTPYIIEEGIGWTLYDTMPDADTLTHATLVTRVPAGVLVEWHY